MSIYIEEDSITRLYCQCLKALDEQGGVRQSDSKNPTAINPTKELLGPTLVLTRPRSRHILEPLRNQSIDYLVNEFAWYLSGRYNVSGIPRIGRVWQPYTDCYDVVHSNYGASLFHEEVKEGETQWTMINKILNEDPESRRAIFFLNIFDRDYPSLPGTKDFPCTVYGQVIIDGDVLHLVMNQRSCDVVNGFGFDVPIFTLFQEMFARSLGYRLGKLIHHHGSLHIYEEHFPKLDGKDFQVEDPKEELFLPRMEAFDARKLVKQDYSADTMFMEAMREYLDPHWLE